MAQTVDLAVIGGGASGLMAACSALMHAKRPLRVVVLEKQERGEARMKEFGHVNVPQSAFIAVLKGTIKE